MKKKKKERSLTLGQMIKAATKAGAEVSFGLKPSKMPEILGDDHAHVRALIEESHRLTTRGAHWMGADNANPVAAQKTFEMAWAYSLASAWLRCHLRGEFKAKPPVAPEKK